ncbi:dihydroneopterin aldolase [Ammonicoccus fulvus]|uniref:7,8-dihydroneopterin aldolase n=1 Tax=Ammonicoccus fulvus TaxID=3138240 RepID=A0ABZ3FPG9_9ACTN
MGQDAHDRIALRGIRAFGHHGVLPHERTYGQQFSADVTIAVDLSVVGESDRLADTVDYSEIAAAVSEELAGSPLDTIEALAHRIADRCLGDDRIEEVEVTVHKPMAPVSVVLDDIAVTITRSTR